MSQINARSWTQAEGQGNLYL